MLRQFCCIGRFEVTGGHSSVSAFFVYFGKWRKAVFVAHISRRFVCDLPQSNVFHFNKEGFFGSGRLLDNGLSGRTIRGQPVDSWHF
ncbi:hypothetical protein VN97_g1811 [Penicillium thymicola]|uniref:Uncharacterized protein n=1 Tax=Penicillium thymicola TaxID=293382 RepID=A0AAI9TRM2_PENTH|nr:hypothetical protein VN97_g1811 [Penicillium thymicola]